MRNSHGEKMPVFDLVIVWGTVFVFTIIAFGYIAKASGWWYGF